LKKIFITGGTGFFGKAILRFCQENNYYDKYSIYIFSRNVTKFRLNCPKSINLDKVNFYEGDILNPSTFPENIFDSIIHAATDSTTGLSLNYIDRSNQIVDGTRNILEWCNNSKVKRFLYVSSGGVYGAINDAVSENQNFSPSILNIDSTYSISKLFSEHLCFLYSNKYNFSVSVARCFSFIGKDLPLDAHFAVGNFIGNVLKGESININGDGSPIRSYMDQDDLANWLFEILFIGKNKEIYNVGSNEEISIKNLAELIKKLFDSEININIKYNKISGQSSNRNYYVPNISKALGKLNLKLNFSLANSIKKILSTQNTVF
jgi:dTDP-glucose 4,6-dehydratase